MASIINLEDLPQLVMEKITSFLNHKHLLALEQVSRKLKSAVDAHFAITDHLIIGPLPKVDEYSSYNQAIVKKCFDGLLKIIQRCGIRLRTIHITVACQLFHEIDNSLGSYRWYFRQLFASAEMSNNCPNIEDIIVSPNMDMDITTALYYGMSRQQKFLIDEADTEIYANNIKLSNGGTCKLRSIRAYHLDYQRILDHYSNLEQISVYDSFFEYLPQFLENGLKDLHFKDPVNIQIAKKYCNIWKDLRTLSFYVTVENDSDIATLNKLQFAKNVELEILMWFVSDGLLQLNENVCNSIVECNLIDLTDWSLMNKLKNLQSFDITNSEQLKVIAEGSFPELRGIAIICNLCSGSNCVETNMCDVQKFLPLLFTNKGNHITYINIKYLCSKSMHLVWKALKHCTALKSIEIAELNVSIPLTLTDGDMRALFNSPNLQDIRLLIPKDNPDALFRELMDRAVKEHTDFDIEYEEYKFPDIPGQVYLLYRRNFHMLQLYGPRYARHIYGLDKSY